MQFLYSSLFCGMYLIVFVVLSLHVIQHRRRTRTPIGNPQNDDMLARKIRVQGNFAEYAPLMLIALLLLEAAKYRLVVMVLGLLFLLGRAMHAWALLQAEPKKQNYGWRMAAMITTFCCLLCAAAILLATFFLAPR